MTEVLGGQSDQILYGLGQGVIYSVWQCAALAALLAGALALLRGRSPNVRYAAACSAMALMLLVPAATVWQFVSAAPDARMEEVSEPSGVEGESNVEPDLSPRQGVNPGSERAGRPVSMSPQPSGE